MKSITNSSSVYAIGYDEDAKQLFVEFSSGATYEYEDVPKEIYDELMSAPSVGKFIQASIKGQYTCTRV